MDIDDDHLTVCTECMIRVLFVGSLAPFLVLLILMSFRAMAGTLDPVRRSEEKRYFRNFVVVQILFTMLNIVQLNLSCLQKTTT